MKITPIASGSAGNAYLITTAETRLLIDCGIRSNELMQKLDFNLPDLCLVTHSHKDHSRAVADLWFRGVDIRMSKECAEETGKNDYCVVEHIEHNNPFQFKDLLIWPLKMPHDVHCLGFLITEESTGERLFFATDCAYIPYEFASVDYLMLECNHDKELLYQGELTPAMEAKNKRLMATHMSIDALLLWLNQADLSKTKRIYLLHMSDGNSNSGDFKERVIAATGCPVTVC